MLWVQTTVAEHRRAKIVLPTPKKKEAVEITEELAPVVSEELDLSAWLLSLDSSGALGQYHKVLAENFDSVPHIVAVYEGDDGHMDPSFFEDVGVKKIGHRRRLEQWFEVYLAKKQAAEAQATVLESHGGGIV